ncbi:hypothetical protein [Legionella gratiana]|uniref:hypothetical protein n=1 Tax=Legionella gratiana TaxID=45066 RepID=UPI000A43F45F|nr:hypothetical protein [Legionella gratiana]
MSTCFDPIIQADTLDEKANVYLAKINTPFNAKEISDLEIQFCSSMIYRTD